MKSNQVQRKFLYSVIVAGKSGEFAKNKLTEWISEYVQENENPLDCIERLSKKNKLRESFEDVKTGNYTKLTRACNELIESEIDLKTCSTEELEEIYGVGPKTSRFFVMWTRDDEEYGILDTHILSWLQEQGYDVPDQTPQDLNEYEKIQEIFVKEAEKLGMNPQELDTKIWKSRSNGGFSTEDDVK